jgi:hypothetical protein
MKKVICMLAIMASLMAVSSAGAALISGSGSVFYNLGRFIKIWDISGDYTTQSSGTYFGQSVKVTFIYNMVQDANTGKLTGTGTCVVSEPNVANPNTDPNDPNNIIVMPFNIKGAVNTQDNVGHVKATFAGKGTALFDGNETPYKLSKKIDALIISDTNLITGFANERISVKGQQTERHKNQLFDATLPTDMNGVATLNLDCHSNGRQIISTGELTLSNGKVLNFNGGGIFDAKTGLSTLRLTSGKNRLKLEITDKSSNSNSSNNITLFDAKLLGQKFKLP